MCYLPTVLIFHVKRFEVMGKKITKHIEYPSYLEMKDFQEKSDNVDKKLTKYQLIALTEHVGSSDTSGHYTAHAIREGNWYKFDDEYFHKVSEKDALSREAYLLFYKRVD